jgi:hypothetical protein
MCTPSETSNDHALFCILNHGNTVVQLLHCLSLSSCHLESTLPPAAQLLLSQSQKADLVGHHLQLSNVLERISRPSCELLYQTNTSHRKQETFLYEYPLQWVLLPTKKRTTERCSSVVYTSSTVAILTIETSLWASASGSATWTVLPPSDTHRKPITSIKAVLLPFVTYKQNTLGKT